MPSAFRGTVHVPCTSAREDARPPKYVTTLIENTRPVLIPRNYTENHREDTEFHRELNYIFSVVLCGSLCILCATLCNFRVLEQVYYIYLSPQRVFLHKN